MIICGLGYSGPHAPCSKECKNRTPDCHGKCDAYLKYEKLRHEYLAQIQLEKHGIPYKKTKETRMW